MQLRKNPLIWFDLLILGVSYIIVVALKSWNKAYFTDKYFVGLTVFVVTWFSISMVFRKFRPQNPPYGSISLYIIMINILILGVITILMYGVRLAVYSRFIVFGTITTATFLEIITHRVYRLIPQINGNGSIAYKKKKKKKKNQSPEAAKKQAIHDIFIRDISLSLFQLKKDIVEECGEVAFNFINEHIDLLDPHNLVISTTTRFNILYQPDNYLKGIINLKRTNDFRYINKFFEAVNMKLLQGGTYIGCAETKNLRKQRILKKFPPVLNWIYYFFDYIIKRVFPKFKLTKGIYFLLTRGENRVLTRAEILGRLYSCGFEVNEEGYINGKYFFVSNKIKEPAYDDNPTYGVVARLPRIGKDGKIIRVYKMRTMHPYAEYLQDYIYKKNHLEEGGKFKNDFRISSAGRLMRFFWLDELPMLINWFRGELKLVGVRPISRHYFNLYSKEHQRHRIKYKPGLVPPYYADLPKSLQEIEDSERKFLDAYDKHPFITNWRYFWKAWYNIVVKRARSR